MDVRGYLKNLRRLREVILEDEIQVKEIEEKILTPAGIDPSQERVKESIKPSEPVLKMIELRQQLIARKAQYELELKKARDFIHTIDNRMAANVLLEYYIHSHTPGEIALKFHLSERHIRRLHDEGITELEKRS